MRKIGFDNDKYLEEQSSAILERVRQSSGKLYLEFGGKILFDYHAARVLPGFDPNVKMRLLQRLSNEAQIILCIYAGDIERRKVRADFGITYDVDAMKLIDDLKEWGVSTPSVVITRYEDQPAANIFKNKLERHGVNVYTHRFTKGYPTNLDLIVSDEGYGANSYIETDKKLIIVTGPGPGSGKLATCLSQLYHEYRQGKQAGYAKFETFPIWNIPLKHPVNVAYEAATVDIGDFNMIDPFHLEAYGKSVVNYNRDVEVFPVLERILERITGKEAVYKSPTDMGVNRAGFGIADDDIVREASRQEIIRRYMRYACEYALGLADAETVERAELIMKEVKAKPEDRSVYLPAREAAKGASTTGKGHDGIFCGAAIELRDGRIVTGKNSPSMHASSSLILNAVKVLAGVPDDIHLLDPSIVESVTRFKKNILSGTTMSLDLDEALISLVISANSNEAAQKCVDKLTELRGCEAHITHMPTPGDEAGLRRLGVNLTSEPRYSTKGFIEVNQ